MSTMTHIHESWRFHWPRAIAKPIWVRVRREVRVRVRFAFCSFGFSFTELGLRLGFGLGLGAKSGSGLGPEPSRSPLHTPLTLDHHISSHRHSVVHRTPPLSWERIRQTQEPRLCLGLGSGSVLAFAQTVKLDVNPSHQPDFNLKS